MKQNENIYYVARKNASKYNDKLYSREGASEQLGISVSTLADYELGLTKVIPVDKVTLMADLYNAPELKNIYCKYECPIGKSMCIATNINLFEKIVIKLMKELESDNTKFIKDKLIDIALDGDIDNNELCEINDVLIKLNNLSIAISELKLIIEKAINKNKYS